MALIRPEVWNDDAVAPGLADRYYALLPTTTPTAPASLGTLATSANGVPIVSARLNPAGDITGMIMQAGLFDGQRYEARNISTHTITFAASSSHVADGSTCVIAALTVCVFVWDATSSLWMHNGL